MMLSFRRLISTSLRGLVNSYPFYSSTTGVGTEIELTITESKIAIIGFNRPEAKNSLSIGLISRLTAILSDLEHDEGKVRAVIFRSLVPGIFCAGADLKERLTIPQDKVAGLVSQFRMSSQRIENLHKPVIFALDGAALGGGLEIALAGDLLVASSDARLGLVETRLAIIPGGGGTQRLPRLIGSAKAKELIFTAKVLSGTEAYEAGIAQYVVKQNEKRDAAFQKALDIANQIIPHGPIAVKLAKQAINAGMQTDLTTGLKIEEACYAQVIPTNDRIEGLKAFKEKRTPVYSGN
ncbi:hypothetical protein LOD99_13190 [Oopsacas minuta]|uniref:Uncharacterized protein n=1 Tax=Oopsacas minuta TaxID=111878 RepID=A0AAV7JB54_9METZ|nr:hypothetical protein LOD99_13190 [Oopsacas minuta]